MKGLDAWIEGRNDPFFDADWQDHFSIILDQCYWFEDYEELNADAEQAMLEAVAVYINPDRYYPKKVKQLILKDNAVKIAAQFKLNYDSYRAQSKMEDQAHPKLIK